MKSHARFGKRSHGNWPRSWAPRRAAYFTPTLGAACKGLALDVPAGTDRGHGRRVRRTVKAVQATDWIDFPAAAQIIQLRRTRTIKGRKTIEVVYAICSLDMIAASPAIVATWIQGHWSIEDSLHWVRDVTFDDDRHQLRTTGRGLAAQHRDQPAPTGRTHQDRHRTTTPRPMRQSASSAIAQLINRLCQGAGSGARTFLVAGFGWDVADRWLIGHVNKHANGGSILVRKDADNVFEHCGFGC